MSKSDFLEAGILNLIFKGTTITGLADNTVTSPATNLYISLHTADPTDAGNEGSSEATYTGYARVAVARTAGGWTVSGTSPSQAVNAAVINFAACTAGSNTLTYFAIGVGASGTTNYLYSGALTAALAVSAGITPSFASGSLQITED